MQLIFSQTVGCVLLFSAVAKLLEPAPFFRLLNSGPFAVGLAIEFVFGSLLVLLPRLRALRALASGLFSFYGVYHLAVAPEACDCFGAFSRWLSQWGMLLVNSTLAVACLAATFTPSRSDRYNRMPENHPSFWTHCIRLIALSAALICVTLVANLYQSPQLCAQASTISHTEVDGKYSVAFELTNTTSEQLVVCGAQPSCTQSLEVSVPVAEPGKRIELVGTVAGISTGEFVKGVLHVYVKRPNGKIGLARIPWVGKSPSHWLSIF